MSSITSSSSYLTRNAIPRRRSNQQPSQATSISFTVRDVDNTAVISSILNETTTVLPPMQRTHSSTGNTITTTSSSHSVTQPLQRTQYSRVTNSNRIMSSSNHHNTQSLSSSSSSSSSTSTNIHSTAATHGNKYLTASIRYVRHIIARPYWGYVRNIFHHTTENDKYHRVRYKQSTSTVLLMTGLIFVAVCSLVLVWNMHFKFYDSLSFANNVLHSNITTILALDLPQPQPQPQILPIVDTTTIHPMHDLAAKSSYKGKLTGLRADILTSNNKTVQGKREDQPQPLSFTSRPTEWRNDENVVHVIQTRFMQNQHHLLALGQARLRLFTAVTVPSMRYQTQQQFLWIVRTDPNLHDSILQPLMETMALLPNAILVASNRNPEGFRDSSCISDITTETLLVGNMEYVQSYYLAGQTHTVLETRCDADDAIAIDFVELIQKSATSGLYPLRSDWIVYCADNHMEWQYDNPWANDVVTLPSNNNNSTSHSKSDISPNQERGALLVLRSGHCVTPGLTWGYSINATRRDIPVSQHNKIQKTIKPCGTKKHGMPPLQTKCLLKLGDDFPLALRARTPTSAGMDHVFVANQTEDTFPMEHLQQSKARTLQVELWNILFVLFGVDGDDLYHVRKYVSEHFIPIAKDALAGQCTKGHSCKHSSKQLLQKLLDAADEKQNSPVIETVS